MPKKYIKGKDGKFQGSVPDGNALPKTPASLPKRSSLHSVSAGDQPRAEFRRIAQQYSAKMKTRDGRSALELETEEWLADTGGEELFVDSRTSDVSGNISMTPEKQFVATVDVSYLDRTRTVETQTFSHPTEAEDWVENRVKERANEIYEFEQAYSYSPDGLTSMTDKALAVVPDWQEKRETFNGVEIGFMRGATRGATVQRLGPRGNLIMVHDYANAEDEEGTLYTERHLPDFETAWSMARYLCAKTV